MKRVTREEYDEAIRVVDRFEAQIRARRYKLDARYRNDARKRIGEIRHGILDLISEYDLRKKNRKRELVSMRQALQYWMKFNTEYSLETIALFFNQDHSTICNSCKSVTKALDMPKQYPEIIKSLEIVALKFEGI